MPVFSSGDQENTTLHGYNVHSALYNSLSISNIKIESPLHRPQPVHRLDKETGGLLLVAKTFPTLVALTEAFKFKKVEKVYRAIVTGRLEGSGVITKPLGGKDAVTYYESLDISSSSVFGYITTVKVVLETGRTHQIRRHLALLGHPIVGDMRYGLESFDQANMKERKGNIANDVKNYEEDEEKVKGGDQNEENAEEERREEKEDLMRDVNAKKRCMYLWSLSLTVAHPVLSNSVVHYATPEPLSFQRLRGRSLS